MIEYNRYAPYTELQKKFLDSLFPVYKTPKQPKLKEIHHIEASAKCFSIAEATVVRDCFMIMLPHCIVKVLEVSYLDKYIVQAYTIESLSLDD